MSANSATSSGPVSKDSLIRWNPPVLVTEKTSNSKTDKKAKTKKSLPPKQLPPVDPSKNPESQVEDILDSIIPPR